MNKLQQGAYCLRDYLYTIVLALFGWTLADFELLMAKPIDAISSFFSNIWGLSFAGITLAGYLVEMIFCPARLHPVDEVPKPWRRWRGMLMEANLVPSVFCDALNLLQISTTNIFRIVGVILYLFSIILTAWYGVNRQRQIVQTGENSFSTGGIYKFIRYPEYFAQLLYSISVPLLFNSWVGWIATLVYVFALVRYVKKLDMVMSKKYQFTYVQYTYRSKRVIPFIF